jgi:hypothetical protein
MAATLTHPSCWFTYVQVAPDARDPTEHVYTQCTLLRNLDYDEAAQGWQGVTFHSDAACRQGAVFPEIREHDRQLMAWVGDTVVMDILY